MATFCGSCGSPLNDQADFCGGCGAPVPRGPQTISRPASPVATGGAYAPVRTTPASAAPAPAPAAKSSNALLKVGLVLVAILFVGGLAAFAAVYYAAHKVSEKIHAVAQGDLGGSKSGGGSAGGLLTSLTGSAGSQAQTSGATDSAGPGGDLCRFLSKEDVSSSTGTTIIRADPAPDGCVYIAHGDPADALTKHMGGMLAKKGADAKSQEMLQKFAGGMFKQQEQSDKNLSAEASTGEIPVITLSFSASGHGESEMKLNKKFMQRLGATDLPGIGDEAFDSADGIMTVRKGNNMFRIMYVSCPCTVDSIKPLAQKVANAL
jgi:hypothetical protein